MDDELRALFAGSVWAIAPQMDALYFFMVLVSVVGLTIVILLIVSFSILYSKKRHPQAVQIEGSTMLDCAVDPTIIPARSVSHRACLCGARYSTSVFTRRRPTP